MVEWGITPEYINANWTEELLTLMFLKKRRRYERLAEARGEIQPKPRRVKDSQLFKEMGKYSGFTVEKIGEA